MIKYFQAFTLFLISIPMLQAAELSYVPVYEKLREKLEIPEHGEQEDLNLDEVKIVYPSLNDKNIDEKCVFLIHTDQSIDDVFSMTKTVNQRDIPNKDCSLVQEIQESKKALIKKNKWNFSFHFGFSRTHYRPTDLKLNSSRVNVTIKNYEFAERTSAGFYNPQNWETWMDAFRWIDEPTNHFVFTLEKNGHNIILSIFHPKFLQKQYQEKHIIGTIDGVDVDEVMDINEPFDGYNNTPGEMYLIRFQNTHLQMAWELGYGYEFKLFNDEKYGALSIRPSIQLGVMSGRNLTVYTRPGEYWEYEYFEDKHKIQGLLVSGSVRVNYRIKNFNLFVEGKYSRAQLTHGFMDNPEGAQYTLEYAPLTFGIGYTFDYSKRKKNKKKKKTKHF